MIVATLLEPHRAALQEAIQTCDPTADAFEVRFDALTQAVAPAELRALTGKPLIATYRRPAEGGQAAMEPQARHALLEQCLGAGFDFADIETDETPLSQPRRTIVSHHDLRATPAAGSILRLAQSKPNETVFKCAGKIRNFADTIQLLTAARELQRTGRRYALMGLGDFPRALTHLLGAAFVYGGGRTNAPGQPDHQSIRATLRHWGDPGPAARLLLVVGDPVEHSLSPRIHNAALRSKDLNVAYGALRVSTHTELQILLEKAPQLGLDGLSVTTPLKDAAFGLCARVSPEAERAQAVNCIRFEGAEAIGHNTDGLGAAEVARRLVNEDGRALVIGSGGAARAFAAQWPTAQLTVAGRNPESLRAIAKRLGCTTIPLTLAAEELGRHDLIVNASREQDPLPLEGYDGALFDFHYGPQATAWQLHAEQTGQLFVGGKELLLQQGLRAFQIWTGASCDPAVMRAALERQG